MPGYTIINLSGDSSNQDVQIAGNFTNWEPKSMKYDNNSKRYEYTVDELVDGSKSGKYNFKFIINGVWHCDQNYASEFDPSGNENNVVMYDYTDDKSASDEYLSNIHKQVSQDNEEEPSTPDPTPYSLSTQSTNTQTATATSMGTTATPAAPVGVLPVTQDPKDSLSSNTQGGDSNSTAASKAIPQTEALKKSDAPPTNGSSEFIPLTESNKDKPSITESSSIPNHVPVKRPEPPTKTEEPTESEPKKKELNSKEPPAVPQPVSRPEAPQQTGTPKAAPIIPDSSIPIPTNSTASTKGKAPRPEALDAEATKASEAPKASIAEPTSASTFKPTKTSTTSNGTNGTKTTTNDPANNQILDNRPGTNPSSSGKEFPEYSIGFFATILHVITQFFRRWFSGNQ